MAKRTLTQQDLKNHLQEQIEFLKISADSFDGGFDGEAKRLAVTLRVLFHETSRSKSLIEQLELADIKFFDSAYSEIPGNLSEYKGLIGTILSDSGAKYYAPLDDRPFPHREVSFNDWWGADVFRNNRGEVISRKKIILTSANQDGGAHVDPELDEVFYNLSRGEFLDEFYSDSQVDKLILGAEKAAIRQIAHEAIKTLVPGYNKVVHHDGAGMYILGSSRVAADNVKFRSAGRNERCPCGSGIKYKKCCYKIFH
jgi:hypothetical protein